MRHSLGRVVATAAVAASVPEDLIMRMLPSNTNRLRSAIKWWPVAAGLASSS
jgi:hypothetical protein